MIYVVMEHRTGDTIGGIQRHVQVFCENCEGRGVPVTVLTPFDGPALLWKVLFGIGKVLDHIHKPSRARWYYFSRLQLLKIVLRKKLKAGEKAVVYAQDPMSTQAALCERKTGRVTKVVAIAHFSSSTADEWAGKGYFKIGSPMYESFLQRDRVVYPQADKVIFVSKYMQKLILSRMPDFPVEKGVVISNFVDRPLVDESSQTGDIVTIGTLEPRKNQDFLIRVLRECHNRGNRYRFTIIGDGPSRKELESLVAELKLTDFVDFLGARSDASQMVSSHRAYVHAAKMESFGIVLIEGMAAGVPVFAAAVGGIPEVFSDGVEGRFWELNDPAGASEILSGVLNDQAIYDRMARDAQQHWKDNFTSDVGVGKILAELAV